MSSQHTLDEHGYSSQHTLDEHGLAHDGTFSASSDEEGKNSHIHEHFLSYVGIPGAEEDLLDYSYNENFNAIDPPAVSIRRTANESGTYKDQVQPNGGAVQVQKGTYHTTETLSDKKRYHQHGEEWQDNWHTYSGSDQKYDEETVTTHDGSYGPDREDNSDSQKFTHALRTHRSSFYDNAIDHYFYIYDLEVTTENGVTRGQEHQQWHQDPDNDNPDGDVYTDIFEYDPPPPTPVDPHTTGGTSAPGDVNDPQQSERQWRYSHASLDLSVVNEQIRTPIFRDNSPPSTTINLSALADLLTEADAEPASNPGYLHRAWNGFSDGIFSAVKGVAFMVMNPGKVKSGIENAILNPKETGKAIYDGIREKLSTAEGHGELFGDLLLGALTGGVLKAAKESAAFAKIAAKLDEFGISTRAGHVARFAKPDVVAVQTVLRQQYIDAVKGLANKVADMRKAAMSSEQIARALHAERRALGEQFKRLTDPSTLERIYQRNLIKYGDKLGPSVDWLRARGKTWEQIIDSASRPGGEDLGF